MIWIIDEVFGGGVIRRGSGHVDAREESLLDSDQGEEKQQKQMRQRSEGKQVIRSTHPSCPAPPTGTTKNTKT